MLTIFISLKYLQNSRNRHRGIEDRHTCRVTQLQALRLSYQSYEVVYYNNPSWINTTLNNPRPIGDETILRH